MSVPASLWDEITAPTTPSPQSFLPEASQSSSGFNPGRQPPATVIASPTQYAFGKPTVYKRGRSNPLRVLHPPLQSYRHFEALCTSVCSFFSLTYGIVNQKVDPSPCFEVTHILPPSKPTKALQIESPRPVPAYCLDTALSTW